MPRNRTYSFGAHGQSERGGQSGNYCFKPGLVDTWSPPYENGVLTFRPFPGLSPEDRTQFDPYRWSSTDPEEPLGFGDWIRRYPAVRSFGQPSVTFLYNDPSNPIVEDPRMTPAWVLYTAISHAVSQKVERPGWAGLLIRGTGRQAQLPKPSELYLIQGCVMMWQNKSFNPPRGIGDDDKTTVILLSPSAGGALLQQCQAEVQGFAGDPDDFEHRFVGGDPVSLDTGRFVTIYTLSDGDPRVAQQMAPQGWQTQSRQGPGVMGGQQQKPIGYGAFMEPMFGGLSARLREAEPAVRRKVRLWSDLVNIPTLEQQAQLIADKFPPDVICYAWQDSHPEWVPEEVQRRAVAAMQVAMGGAPGLPPSPGMGMVPAGYTTMQPPQPQAGAWHGGPAPGGPGVPTAFQPFQGQPMTAEAATAAVAGDQSNAAPQVTQPTQAAPGVVGHVGWPGGPMMQAPPTAQPPMQPPADGAVPPAIPVGPAAPANPQMQQPPFSPTPMVAPPEHLTPDSATPVPHTAVPAGGATAWPAGQPTAPQQSPFQAPAQPQQQPMVQQPMVQQPMVQQPMVQQPQVAPPQQQPPVAQQPPAVAQPPQQQQPLQPAQPPVSTEGMNAAQKALLRAQSARNQPPQ